MQSPNIGNLVKGEHLKIWMGWGALFSRKPAISLIRGKIGQCYYWWLIASSGGSRLELGCCSTPIFRLNFPSVPCKNKNSISELHYFYLLPWRASESGMCSNGSWVNIHSVGGTLIFVTEGRPDVDELYEKGLRAQHPQIFWARSSSPKNLGC